MQPTDILRPCRPDADEYTTLRKLGWDDFFYDNGLLLRGSPRIVMIGSIGSHVIEVIESVRPKAQLLLAEACPPFFLQLYSTAVQKKSAVLVQVQNAALFITNRPVVFYRHEKATSSGLNVNENCRVEEYKVAGKTFRRILHDAGWRADVDLLLMNCEGAELYALTELAEDKGLRSRVHQISTAIHTLIHEPHKFSKVLTKLREDYVIFRLSEFSPNLTKLEEDYILLRKKKERL